MKHNANKSKNMWHRAVKISGLAVCSTAIAISAQSPTFLPSVSTVAGSHVAGYTGDGGSATSAALSNTLSMASTDPAGNIYIADTGNSVIRRVDAVTGTITTLAGTGVAGYNAAQDGGPATAAMLGHPNAARYYHGELYIADTGNNRIRVVNLSTGVITLLAGGGAAAVTSTPQAGNKVSVPLPQDIAIDSGGNLYYSQQGGLARINRIVLSTGMVTIFAGNGSPGYIGDGGDPLKASFNTPVGLAVDPQNNVYLSEQANKIIRKIDVAKNIISTYVGQQSGTAVCAGALDTLGDGCPGLQALLGTPNHFYIDGAGTLYIPDAGNNRIRKVLAGGNGIAGIVTTIGGTGVTPSSADGSYAVNTAFGGPVDVNPTPTGDLLVSERSISTVRVIRSNSLLGASAVTATSAPVTVLALSQAATGTFSFPSGSGFSLAGAPTCSAGVNITGTVCSTAVTFTPTVAGISSAPLQFADANGNTLLGMSGVGLGPAASLLPGAISTSAGTGARDRPGMGAQRPQACLTALQVLQSTRKGICSLRTSVIMKCGRSL